MVADNLIMYLLWKQITYLLPKRVLLLTVIFLALFGFSAPGSRSSPCDSNPCQNGGQCLDEGNAYQCLCKEGFSGTNCELGIGVEMSNFFFAINSLDLTDFLPRCLGTTNKSLSFIGNMIFKVCAECFEKRASLFAFSLN